MLTWLQETGEVYEGQFGSFTVTSADRLGVVVYRGGLVVAASSVLFSTILVLGWAQQPGISTVLTVLFTLFCIGLGVSLWTIHIYLKALHRTLQVLWGCGCLAAVAIAFTSSQILPLAVYPPYAPALVGVGLVFVALTGLFVKEAFCFNRLQAKALILLVPSLLLGHWLGLLPPLGEKFLLASWALVFAWFALDKAFQQIPPDVGDKSVFAYLKQMRRSEVY